MLVATIGLALIAAACAGPVDPIEVAIKEYPSDVILGSAEARRAPAPMPPDALTLTVPDAAPQPVDAAPPSTRPTAAIGTTTTTTTVPPCPTADPLAVPRREAADSVTAPPKEATYAYHNSGSYDIGGPNAQEGDLPVPSSRTIEKVKRADDGSFTYAVASERGDTTTTTVYRVVPTAPFPRTRAAAEPQAPGMFIMSIVAGGPDGEFRFNFPGGVRLVSFPMIRGETLDSAGTDPATGTTLRFHSEVGDRTKVDACGTPLDSVAIMLTEGKIVSPASNIDFTATYHLASQYGGFSIRDDVTQTGTINVFVPVDSTNVATIDREPKPAEAA